MTAREKRRQEGISNRAVLYMLLGFFAGVVSVSLVSHVLSQQVNWWAWLDSFAQNFGTEIFGAFLTFLLLEVLVGGRRGREAEARRTEERKQWLIRQMRSRVNEEAVQATEEMRVAGWLWDGSLHEAALFGANLDGANLSGAGLVDANLRGANLQGADLTAAHLVGADLRSTNLIGASLVEADLRKGALNGADMEGTSLREANLGEANLRDANLEGADLRWARLGGTDLSGANLKGAHLGRTNLFQATFTEADLTGARSVSPDQLKMARSLFAATMPDGTVLPADPGWRDALEAWLEVVALDRNGLVMPAAHGDTSDIADND